MASILGLGNITVVPPEPAALINTSEWGEVPANQVLIATRKGCSHCDAMIIAHSLDGSVVGYIDFINLYQIETHSVNEVQLREDLSKAKRDPCVKFAFPHQRVFVISDTNITPDMFNVSVENTSSGYIFKVPSVVTRTHIGASPLDDPIYLNDNKSSYRIVGVQQAWDEISNFRPSITWVKVGVIDDGLYKGYGEFDGIVHIDTKSSGSLLEKPSSMFPIAGSHGTGIMNIIAADPDNGGLVGIASEPLRDNLTVSMINMDSPMYTKTGDEWYMGILLAICQAGMSSDIVSFSEGNSKCDPGAVTASKDFFKEWANTSPNHLFICSAGNEGKAIDGNRRFPYTYNLPNVITVGCVNNDGSLNAKSNRIGNNFEVTLAAPGDQAIWGKDDKGRIQKSGGMTSMSVPFVTATAALIRSLDPSLNASSIKSILTETARKSIDVEGNQVPAPKEAGGRVLAIDLAVQKVIANKRNSSEAST